MSYPLTLKDAKEFSYNFWKNKPVKKLDENICIVQKICDNLSDRKSYGSEPIKLPNGMKWMEVDTTNDLMMESIATFLKLYNVNDTNYKFRYCYTRDYIRWALGERSILVTILSSDNSICAVIGANLNNVTVFDKRDTFGVIKFICSHPTYRKKKIAYTLIDEMTRRIINKFNIDIGCFVTNRCVPSPIVALRLYNRPIDYVKLQKCGFVELEEGVKEEKKNPERIQEKFNVNGEMPKNYLPMTETDLPQVFDLYNKFMTRFNVHQNYTIDELKLLLLNNSFVKSYVELNDDKVVDFISYYKLNYLNRETNQEVSAGYLFLYSCNTTNGEEMMRNLTRSVNYDDIDILIVYDSGLMSDILLTNDFDVADESDNESYSKMYQHRFLRGNKKYYFNFFNFKCSNIKPKQIHWNIFN